MDALDPSFNAVVRDMAGQHAPAWRAADDVSFEQLKERTLRDGYITVWTGASDRTIFGSAHVNHAFRAWHDAAHLAGDHPFTPEGERAAAALQCAQLVEAYGDTPAVRHWCAIVDCEVNGQVEYAALHGGEFPADQLAFAKAYLLPYRGA